MIDPHSPTPSGRTTAAVVVNGQCCSALAGAGALAGVGTYTSAVSVNVQLGGTLVQINAGQPYQFTAAQVAQLAAAGVTLSAT